MEITVLPDPDARPLPQRIAAVQKLARWSAVVALALSGAILATAVALPGDRDRGRRVVSAMARESGPAGVAAAYGYPLRCLSITIIGARQRYARADFDHKSPCGRFTGYSTAIFIRVLGAWRPVLEAVGYVCPVTSLPVDMQTELGVCPPPSGRTRRPPFLAPPFAAAVALLRNPTRDRRERTSKHTPSGPISSSARKSAERTERCSGHRERCPRRAGSPGRNRHDAGG